MHRRPLRNRIVVRSVLLVSGLACVGVDRVEGVVGGSNDPSNPTTDAVVLVNGALSCTGTLIAPRIVVTAGHCINHGPPIRTLPATNDGGTDWEAPGYWYPLFDSSGGIPVVFGSVRSSPALTAKAYYYNHPGYADVVMLGLDRPVPESTAKSVPVMTRIPDGQRPAEFFRGKRLTVAGWGFTDGCQGSTSPRQRQQAGGTFPSSYFRVPPDAPSPNRFSDPSNPNRYGFVGQAGAFTAGGDSGGPVFWTKDGQRRLVGTNQQCVPGNGGLYFGTWSRGGTDDKDRARPDLAEWYERVLTAYLVSGGSVIPDKVDPGDRRTFRKPSYGPFDGNRLDWCFIEGEQCGRTAANAFCRLKGYTHATAFEIDADIGAQTPTYVVGAASTCTDAHCDGFASITCENGLEGDWVIDRRGVCRDHDGEYPRWSEHESDQARCSAMCEASESCQGFAMSRSRDYCQLFGSGRPKPASAPGTRVTRGDSGQPGYDCFLKSERADWAVDPRGVCRDADGEYPRWSSQDWGEARCARTCRSNPNCQGFAMSKTRNYCQFFGSDGQNAGSDASTWITQGDADQPQYTCYLKHLHRPERWKVDPRGVCRDDDGKYPRWSNRKWPPGRCSAACAQDSRCQGFAMHESVQVCQLFGPGGDQQGTSPGTRVTRGDPSQPMYDCYLKR